MKKSIKDRKEELFEIIKNAEAELKNLRRECKHEKKNKGPWEWAPGHIYMAYICDECGECLGPAVKEQ